MSKRARRAFSPEFKAGAVRKLNAALAVVVSPEKPWPLVAGGAVVFVVGVVVGVGLAR